MAAGALISKSAKRMASAGQLKLLLIDSEAEDSETLRRILHKTQWEIWQATTGRDAQRLIANHDFTAIFCEAASNDIRWKDLLTPDGSLGTPPLVVVSRLADEYLWCEVLNLGGYDVLAKPFAAKEVMHVLETISLQRSERAVKAAVEAGFDAG